MSVGRCEWRCAGLALFLVILPQAILAADLEAVRQKVQVCFACHGPEGNSASSVVPSLAGQPQQFIATELFLYREGRRKDPQMTPLVVSLSNADMNDFAAYFAAQTLAPPARSTDPGKVATGRRLTEQYHCVSCHGSALMGQQHIPRLAGQQPEYLRQQLHGFRAAIRADIDGLMTSAAQPLSDADIEVLADYLSGLR